jgi:hypothetical protein
MELPVTFKRKYNRLVIRNVYQLTMSKNCFYGLCKICIIQEKKIYNLNYEYECMPCNLSNFNCVLLKNVH